MMEELDVHQASSSQSMPGSSILTPSRKPKRAVVTDNVSIMNASAEDCGRRPYLDDEELLRLAMQDIAKLFGLENEVRVSLSTSIGSCFFQLRITIKRTLKRYYDIHFNVS